MQVDLITKTLKELNNIDPKFLTKALQKELEGLCTGIHEFYRIYAKSQRIMEINRLKQAENLSSEVLFGFIMVSYNNESNRLIAENNIDDSRITDIEVAWAKLALNVSTENCTQIRDDLASIVKMTDSKEQLIEKSERIQKFMEDRVAEN